MHRTLFCMAIFVKCCLFWLFFNLAYAGSYRHQIIKDIATIPTPIKKNDNLPDFEDQRVQFSPNGRHFLIKSIDSPSDLIVKDIIDNNLNLYVTDRSSVHSSRRNHLFLLNNKINLGHRFNVGDVYHRRKVDNYLTIYDGSVYDKQYNQYKAIAHIAHECFTGDYLKSSQTINLVRTLFDRSEPNSDILILTDNKKRGFIIAMHIAAFEAFFNDNLNSTADKIMYTYLVNKYGQEIVHDNEGTGLLHNDHVFKLKAYLSEFLDFLVRKT